MESKSSPYIATTNWPSAVPQKRWQGFRRDHSGLAAFESLDKFIIAQQSELYASFSPTDRATLGRLLKRGQKSELELFVRTHGANPIFDPMAEIETSVGIAKADVVDLSLPAQNDAVDAILNGEVVHVLFQAGEATRFEKGPFYRLNPTRLARSLKGDQPELAPALNQLENLAAQISSPAREFLVNGALGPKQAVMIRAALRRLIADQIASGYLPAKSAVERYQNALRNQKLLFFISRVHGLGEKHDQTLREEFKFFGFNPENILTIEQELVPGIRLDEDGNIFLMEEPWARDAAGHLYVMIQAARRGDFTTYTESGRAIKPMEMDALGYLSSRGGRYLNMIRINDLDRHTTEIVNPKAFGYARSLFEKGYVNAIEGVSNPSGQKGGTGVTFGDPNLHILTETHENSFPSLSRVFEKAMQEYLQKNENRHPAYNAMRQWASLQATRQALKEYGGRIVFVPRQKVHGPESTWYIGVDMPMGDLSLLGPAYKSRMFQFVSPDGPELLIHDMKQVEQLGLYLQIVIHQLQDPNILAAVEEIARNEVRPFKILSPTKGLYGAPAPEFATPQ